MAASIQIKKVSYRHQGIMDLMLAHPELQKQEIAARLNYTNTHLSVIVNSSAFQAQLGELREQFVSESIIPLADKVRALADLAVDRTIDNLEHNLLNAKETADLATKTLTACGFGPKSENQTNTQVNIGISPELLARAQERMNTRNA